jgi:hypothetical protein
MPEKLARQIQLIEEFPSLGLVHTDFFDLVEGVLRPRAAHLPAREVPSGWVTGRLFLSFFGLPSTMMVRRALFDRAGGFDSTYPVCEDYDLLLRLSRLGQFGYLGEPLVAHRLHAGSVSDKEVALVADTLSVLERFLEQYPGLREECGGQAVAERLADLHQRQGPRLFWQDDFVAARRHLYAAWRLRPERLSSLALLLAARLPAPAIRATRALKRSWRIAA